MRILNETQSRGQNLYDAMLAMDRLTNGMPSPRRAGAGPQGKHTVPSSLNLSGWGNHMSSGRGTLLAYEPPALLTYGPPPA